jgi:hypothetical protein
VKILNLNNKDVMEQSLFEHPRCIVDLIAAYREAIDAVTDETRPSIA